MLGWLFWGLVIGSAAAAIIIAVTYLNKAKAKNELKNKNIKRATVRDIVKDPNVAHIKLDGLDEDGNKVEIQIDAEDYDSTDTVDAISDYIVNQTGFTADSAEINQTSDE